VSVVVPTLEEETTIVRALDHLATLRPPAQVIVADGGSRDATVSLARAHRLAPTVLVCARGRARQMNAGAARADGELLVFLHADTRLPPGAGAALASLAGRPGVVGGNFALRFDGPGAFPRLLGAWYALQRRWGVFYGDSVIVVRASAFRRLGGYPDVPIMEDLLMARALRRLGQTRCLPGPAVTSSRRWRRQGIPRTVASWLLVRWLFAAGVPARRLARLYPPAR
jgi:rSAM/selenodomain-associated transferase 2